MNKRKLILTMAALMLCGQASADDARRYHIPAQSLNNALLKFSADSGVEILFPADKLRGFNSGGLDGKATHAQALSRLLQGSGMTYRFVDAKTVTVEQAPAPDKPEPQSSSEGQTMPKVTVEADAGYDLTDPYSKDYYSPMSSAGTKTDTPILDTPMSISVATRKLLDDQQAFRVGDALKNFSGINSGFSFRDAGGNEAFVLRGFSTEVLTNGALNYREGVRLQGFPQPVAALDRIELLKGPATAVYGRTEPGGIINFVPKDALSIPYYSVQQQFGSFDLYRTSADATGPLTQDGSLLYRFNLEHLSKNSFRDFVYNDLPVVHLG